MKKKVKNTKSATLPLSWLESEGIKRWKEKVKGGR